MPDTILVVNAGSSSIKFQLFDVGSGIGLVRRLRGQIEGIGVKPHLIVRDARGTVVVDEACAAAEIKDAPAAIGKLGAWLQAHLEGSMPVAVGHRVVHGGPDYDRATLVDDRLIATLERYAPLAPLHQHNNLAPIRALRAINPALPQVACFDTAFHRGHPEVADRYAIPETLYQQGVRRYGFHGLSYEYIASRLPEAAPEIAAGRVVVAHLGSGASMCALSANRSMDSTMGFTALDGLPMGTRPGQIDAGIVLFLLARKNMSACDIERLLYHDCGLKGLSGISNDVRDLLASDDSRARLALDYFCYRISRELGALTAALGGIDGIVFTAGIGENAPAIRADVCRRASWLGVKLDTAANDRNGPRISTADSAVAVYVIPTDEELMIARATLRLLREPSMSSSSRPPEQKVAS
jgi:acetate kinase